MAGNARSSIQIGITADAKPAEKGIDATARRVRQLEKQMARFRRQSDPNGVERYAESISGLSDRTLGLARTLERATGALGLLTSGGSLLGMAELTRRWASAGNTLRNTSIGLGMAPGKLALFEGAGRQAGISAATVDQSLQGLNNTLNAAAWGRGGDAIPWLNLLHISARNASGGAATAQESIGKLADGIARLNGHPTLQRRALQHLGMSPEMLPLLDKGSAGLERYRQEAQRTGGAMTDKMVRDARKMQHAWTDLEMTVDGVTNRVVDRWSGAVTAIIKDTARWIQKNRALSDSLAQIGVATGTFAAPWLLKRGARALLRRGAPAAEAEGAAEGGMLGGIAGRVAWPLAVGAALWNLDPLGLNDVTPAHAWRSMWRQPSGAGGTGAIQLPGAGAPSGRIRLPTDPKHLAVMRKMTRDFRSLGYTRAQTAGWLANAAAESDFDPHAVGDHGTSFGLFQLHGARARLFAQWLRQTTGGKVTDPRKATIRQQVEFANWEVRYGDQRKAGKELFQQTAPRGSGYVIAKDFERPEGGYATWAMRANAADQFMPQNQPVAGQVKVDVHIHHHGGHAPVTANAVGSGAAIVTPPRVETSLDYAR